jgi:ribosome maturation factor RimP
VEIRSKLSDLATEVLNPSLFLVEVVASAKNLSKITIVIDGDHGVTIDDCSNLSRALSAKLDELDFGSNNYVLEVTTPGLDHPLKLKRQFHKNLGRGLKVHRKDKSIILGKLVRATDESVILNQEVKEGKVMVGKELAIPFEEIEKAFVMVSFK